MGAGYTRGICLPRIGVVSIARPPPSWPFLPIFPRSLWRSLRNEWRSVAQRGDDRVVVRLIFKGNDKFAPPFRRWNFKDLILSFWY